MNYDISLLTAIIIQTNECFVGTANDGDGFRYGVAIHKGTGEPRILVESPSIYETKEQAVKAGDELVDFIRNCDCLKAHFFSGGVG